MTLNNLINKLSLMDGAFKENELRIRSVIIMDGVDYLVGVCQSVIKKDIAQLSRILYRIKDL